MAKKFILMLCMLVVTTAQLYSNAFAVPMNDISSLPIFDNNHHETHAGNHHNFNEVAENCCEQLMVESSSHCSSMQNSSIQSCDEMTDCAQMQCVSPVDVGLSVYLYDHQRSLNPRVSVNDLLLTENSNSLYRPPITH